MDHRMPIKSGFDAAKEILALNRDQKIIFASADSTIKGKALSIGIERFLEKPFKYTKLVEIIKDILNEST
ncbi:MAG: response regulator [Promethearchaeia archaeon]